MITLDEIKDIRDEFDWFNWNNPFRDHGLKIVTRVTRDKTEFKVRLILGNYDPTNEAHRAMLLPGLYLLERLSEYCDDQTVTETRGNTRLAIKYIIPIGELA
jgi:hypothetical protein